MGKPRQGAERRVRAGRRRSQNSSQAADGLRVFFFFFNFFFSMFIYFWDRERQSMNGGGAEREGDTESETGSRL